jgi:Cu2+-exporting ATPase
VVEKRLRYRLFAFLSVLANYFAGFYVIGSLMIAVVFLAFKLTYRTEAYSRKSLADAFALHTPASVWVIVEGMEIEIPFARLRIGDVIVLSAGQTIPVDGVIVQGMAAIDQHMLTGESQPVEKTIGDAVLAPTLILSGTLQIRVEKTGQATAAAQIGEILNNAASYRLSCAARSEQLADKLTLPVLAASGVALGTVGLPGAVAILNSGFGSTMLFSGPLSMLSYLNIASHSGILVKDGRSLEILHTIDTVVFDKTGTLTLEQPEVGAIHCGADWSEAEVLRWAATAEHRQSHPIAKAILEAAQQAGVEYGVPDAADYQVGFGIRVQFQGRTIWAGSARFMAQEGIALPDAIREAQAHCQRQGHSLVMVAVNRQLAGAVELQAQLRPETLNLVRSLHERGLKLCILSGDHVEPTRHLAERLDIDDFFAEVLPEGKASLIKELQRQGRTVCFVGDGINDAIALQQADVSVSLRGATTLATDSAQIVLVGHSLSQMDHLFEIAQDFQRNLNRTLMLAYIPGGTLITGVFILHFGMPMALTLYAGGLAAAVSNALYPLTQLSKDKPE